MIYRIRNTALSLYMVLAVCMLFVLSVTNNVMSLDYAEEMPDTVLPHDTVITGNMDDFSERLIYVDGIGYRFCDDVKVFNPRNRMIQLENIEAATQVKVFSNRGCVRKMKVLQFAQ